MWTEEFSEVSPIAEEVLAVSDCWEKEAYFSVEVWPLVPHAPVDGTYHAPRHCSNGTEWVGNKYIDNIIKEGHVLEERSDR